METHCAFCVGVDTAFHQHLRSKQIAAHDGVVQSRVPLGIGLHDHGLVLAEKVVESDQVVGPVVRARQRCLGSACRQKERVGQRSPET